MKRLYRLALVPGMLVLAMMFSLWPCRVFASENGKVMSEIQLADSGAGNTSLTAESNTAIVTQTVSQAGADAITAGSHISANAGTSAAPQATLDTPDSDIETAPADDVPIEQAPSSKNSNDAMMALLEFVVLWSVIYMVIKLVRKKLEKDKPFK